VRQVKLVRPFVLGALCSLWLASAASAQQTGISGRVTDASTGEPVVAAQVSVVGTNLGAQTNAEGVYTVRGVAPGTVTLRVLSIGYAEQTQQVAVTAGQTATRTSSFARRRSR
jgi:hypothetical protein